jgi:hypothetical protein
MHEILKKLLENQILSEETKTEITEAWDVAVQRFTEDKSAEIRTELVEQFVQERDMLAEKVQAFVEERFAAEVAELKEDIEKYRDLEADYAEKLVEEKKQIAVKLAEEIDMLVDKLDSFLEERIAAEMSELQEDLQEAQKASLGKKIFEAFKSEFAEYAKTDEKALEGQVARLEDQIASLKESLSKAEQDRVDALRESKMDQILSPLSGVKREQMTILLSNVATEKLEESYKIYIGKVLKEEKQEEKQTIVESVTDKKQTVVSTGDVIVEEIQDSKQVKASEDVLRMKRLAGLA